MEVLRDSAAIVRNWLGAYSCPSASASLPFVFRPDRLGLGATPEVVSDESKKRKMLGDRIGRKLKKAARKVEEEVPAALLSRDGTEGDEEEPLSRSNAVRERTRHPLPTETVYQGRGKRKRKKHPTVPSPAPGAPKTLPLACVEASEGGTVGASLREDNTTPVLPNGRSDVEPDGNSLAHSGDSTPSGSTHSPTGDGGVDKWKRIGGNSVAESGDSKAAGCSETNKTTAQLQGRMKLKQSFNFSFSLSRSPYSRIRDRCMLTRNGSRTRHRRSICTK